MIKSETRGVGRRIQRARQRKGLSQEQLAEAVDASVHHISHIETGQKMPGLELLVSIANHLDITPNDLLCVGAVGARPYLLKETEELFQGCSPQDVVILQDLAEILRKRNEKG